MANTRVANSLYLDTAGTALTATGKPIKVKYISLYADAAAARIILNDGTVRRIVVGQPTASAVTFLDFSNCPLVFTTSVVVDGVLNNALCTLVFEE